jgi:hypothetical protein
MQERVSTLTFGLNGPTIIDVQIKSAKRRKYMTDSQRQFQTPLPSQEGLQDLEAQELEGVTGGMDNVLTEEKYQKYRNQMDPALRVPFLSTVDEKLMAARDRVNDTSLIRRLLGQGSYTAPEYKGPTDAELSKIVPKK